MQRPVHPKRPPFIMAGVILTLSFLLQWLLQGFSYGMGNGVAPAELVVALGAFIGMPAVLLIAFIAMWSGLAHAVWLGLGAFGLNLVNAGLICVLTASPMESAHYDYSLIDRYPDQAGGILILIGSVIVAVAAIKLRSHRSAATPAPAHPR